MYLDDGGDVYNLIIKHLTSLFDKFHLPKVNTFKPKLFGLKTSFGGVKNMNYDQTCNNV
jgi:hypothetical protein